jgi:HlyD family secretion protein
VSLSTTTSNRSTEIAIRQFQSEADLVRETQEPRSASIAFWLLVAMLFSAAAVTFVIPVDRVVSSASGLIVPSETATVLQALDPSIIKSIDVKEGQTVQKGQLLATLDPTFAAADVDQLRQQVASLTAQIARDQAELDKKPFNPVIDPHDQVATYMALQKSLYNQRAAQYAADVRSFDEKLKLQQATIVKLQTDEARYQEREKISQKVQDMRDTLYKSGSSSLLNLLTATDQRLEVQRTMEFQQNSIIEAQHQISSLSADRDSYIQKWFSDTSQDLVTARNNLDTARSSLEKATKHQDLVQLTASEPGIVLTIDKLSVGSVLKQGDELMVVMPLRAKAEVEAKISSSDVGFLRPGDKATIKVDAFNSSEHGTAEGSVKWISEGAFTTDDNGKPVDPYYKVRITVDAYHFIGVPENFRLIPGMTLAADINVGKRSLAMYLIGGGLRGLGESMREP